MELLQGILGLYAQRADWFAGLLQAHIGLALTAIAMSGMIGLLTGIWIAEHPRIAPPVMGVCNVLYTIPAISLLGFKSFKLIINFWWKVSLKMRTVSVPFLAAAPTQSKLMLPDSTLPWL